MALTFARQPTLSQQPSTRKSAVIYRMGTLSPLASQLAVTRRSFVPSLLECTLFGRPSPLLQRLPLPCLPVRLSARLPLSETLVLGDTAYLRHRPTLSLLQARMRSPTLKKSFQSFPITHFHHRCFRSSFRLCRTPVIVQGSDCCGRSCHTFILSRRRCSRTRIGTHRSRCRQLLPRDLRLLSNCKPRRSLSLSPRGTWLVHGLPLSPHPAHLLLETWRNRTLSTLSGTLPQSTCPPTCLSLQ